MSAIAATPAGSIQANAPLPESPIAYTVVAMPDNFATDPACQQLLAAFRDDPTLKAVRTQAPFYGYKASNPDWQYRWARRVPELPAVIVMQDGQVVYKRSGAAATPQTIAGEMRGGRFLDRLFRPRRPQCDPNDPNCIETPDQQYPPYEPPVSPDRSTVPDGPAIPDTTAIPDTPPITPPPPAVDPNPQPDWSDWQDRQDENAEQNLALQQEILVAIQNIPVGLKCDAPDFSGIEAKIDQLAQAHAAVAATVSNLVNVMTPAPVDPAPAPDEPEVAPVAPRAPIVYVTSAKWCDDCGPVTAMAEAVRADGEHTIAIVEINGNFTNPPHSFTSTGFPAIHDFNTGRSIVGAQECLAFLTTLE